MFNPFQLMNNQSPQPFQSNQNNLPPINQVIASLYAIQQLKATALLSNLGNLTSTTTSL